MLPPIRRCNQSAEFIFYLCVSPEVFWRRRPTTSLWATALCTTGTAWATRCSSTYLRPSWHASCLSPSSTPATPAWCAACTAPSSSAEGKAAASSCWSSAPSPYSGCPITSSTSSRWARWVFEPAWVKKTKRFRYQNVITWCLLSEILQWRVNKTLNLAIMIPMKAEQVWRVHSETHYCL